MCTVEVEWSRSPEDKPPGEIDMRGRVGVITHAYDDAVTKEAPAGRGAKRFRTLCGTAVIVEHPGLYRLCRDIAHVRQCGKPAQRHGIGDTGKVNMGWLEFDGLDGSARRG